MLRQRIISLSCAILFVHWGFNSFGQVKDTSFKLLWYKGKKISDTVVLIPSGQTVTYKPSNGKVQVVTPAKQDVLAQLKKEIENAEQRKTQLSQLIVNSPKGPQKAGFVYQANKAMDQINSSYKDYGENSIELAVENIRTNNTQIPPQILKAYEEVKDFIRQNLDLNSVPSPPSMGFDYCYPCDQERQAAFKRDSIQFMNWLQKEKDNLAKAMKVIGYFGARRVQNLPNDPANDGAIEAEMFDAMEKIMVRLEGKLLRTWNQNKSDETKLPFLAQQMFELIRSQQLMGLKGNPDFPDALQIAASCVEAGMKHLSKAKKDLDYKVLLNVRWIVALFRTAELLGMNSNEFSFTLADFLKTNQFKVYVDAVGKMSQEGTVLGAKMSGENIFAAVPDSNCILKWTLLSPDIEYMKFNLDEATMKAPDVTAAYTGTRAWKTYPADIKLDFCKDERDTFFLHGFMPDGKESWVVQGRQAESAVVTSVFTTCFMDVERIQAMANDPGLQARMEKQLQENYQKFMATYQGSKDPSKMTPAEIQKMNEAMLSAKNMMNNIQSVSSYSFICKEHLKNHQKIVFEGHVNGKELIPNPEIQEAILKIRIEHMEE